MGEVAFAHFAGGVQKRGDGHADLVGEEEGDPGGEEEHEQGDQDHQHGVKEAGVLDRVTQLDPPVVVFLNAGDLVGHIQRDGRGQIHVADGFAGFDHGRPGAYGAGVVAFGRSPDVEHGIAVGGENGSGIGVLFAGELLEKSGDARSGQCLPGFGLGREQGRLSVGLVLHLALQQGGCFDEDVHLLLHGIGEPVGQAAAEDLKAEGDEAKDRDATEGQGPSTSLVRIREPC